MNNPNTTTITALIRLTGLSRDKIKSSLSTVSPTDSKGAVPHYDLGEALRAIIHADETPSDRERRLRGDVIEERLRRMRGEVLPMKDVVAIWHDKLARLAHAIRGIDGINHKQKSRLCQQLRHEVEQIPTELNEVSFPESEDDDASIEEQDTNLVDKRHRNADT